MAKANKPENQDQEKEGLLEFVKGGLSSAWWLTKKALGSETDPVTGKEVIKGHKVAGRGIAAYGGYNLIESILTFEPLGIIEGTVETLFGLTLSEKPTWLGLNKPSPVAEPPKIDLMELSDDQVDQLAERLGLSSHDVEQAHSIAKLDDESFEAKLKEKFGALIETARKSPAQLSKTDKAKLDTIRWFREAYVRGVEEVNVS